jgi:hypothetical protein
MTTQITTTEVTTTEITSDGKKLSKKEIAQQRIAANVAAIEATLVLDSDALTVTGGKEALAIVAEANGSNMDEIKRVQAIEDEFTLCSTMAMHNLATQAAKANKEMQTISNSFPMVGRSHLDVAVHRSGQTDLRMVRHSTNTNAGPLKEAVANFATAMAIYEAQESSAAEVKEKA